MSKLLLVASTLLTVLLALPSAASAQARPFTIGISGGPNFPLGHFAEEVGTGFHVQGSLGFTPRLLPVGVRADLLYQNFPDEHSGSFTEIGGLLNALVGLPLPLARPYALGGIGIINHNEPGEQHGDHTHGGGNHTTLGFNVGGGVEFGFLGLRGVLEARYLDAGEGHRSIPLSFGIRF